MEIIDNAIQYFVGFAVIAVAIYILFIGEELKEEERQRQIEGLCDYNGNTIEKEG
jgi:uncharacterized membrane protein